MKRIIILSSVAVLAVIAVTVAVVYFTASPSLTLYSSQSISKITINGTTSDFKPGMTTNYTKPVTITVAQNGYDFFSKTLDPSSDKISSFTINLTKNSPNPVGSTGYNLFQAARDVPDNLGLIKDSNLNVTIIGQSSFANNYSIYLIKTAGEASDTGIVVVQKDSTGYHIVLGPGTSFSAEEVSFLPTDAINYLQSRGAVSNTQ